MQTKLFTLFLALITSVEFVFASNTKVGNIWYDFDDLRLTASVTYRGDAFGTYTNVYQGNIVIPSSVTYNNKSYSVTKIGIWAFCDCNKLTSVTIPNSVTRIGECAFKGCSGLTSVTIPNSVKIIDANAFYGCENLTSVTMGNSVNYIFDVAFAGCTRLTSIEFPNTLHYIGTQAFRSCKFTSLVIPDSVTFIGEKAFEGSIDSLTSIVVASGNTKYDSRNNCNAIIETDSNSLIVGCRNSIIPNSVTGIGKSAFSYCTGLTSITIPNSVTSIGEEAFRSCTGLTSVTIPNSVTSIGSYAFLGCGMTSLIIPNSVASIGDYAFRNCRGLTSVIIGNSVTTIGGGAFCLCTSLTSVTCCASIPPIMGNSLSGEKPFYRVDCSHISLYVPAQSVAAYQAADQWKNFNPIQPISALPAETTIINIEPSDRSVDITWPSIANAASYELVIKDKSGNIICTLVFNGQGQLVSIAFNAPARDKSEQQTQTAGFQFTVTGLDSGTEYDYTITAKDANGDDLNTESGSFTTTGGDNNPTGLEETQNKDRSSKLLHNGQIFILRGDRTYTLTGAEVK